MFVQRVVLSGAGGVCDQEEFISFSEYPLSAQVACSRLLTTFEQHWGIL